MGVIRIGTSGFSFQDWKGTVYPANIKDSEMFSYYVEHYRPNTVEINYTYYRLPAANTFYRLLSKSPEDFDFTVKLFGGITHEPCKEFPPSPVDAGLCEQFIEGIKPLLESNKLGCLLAQFPERLKPSPEAWDFILSLPDLLGRLPLVYEFRNRKWLTEETFEALEKEKIGFCAVDEPQMGNLMPLVPAVTSDIAYLRLHGRSPNWYKDMAQRYDYLYSEDELKSFVPTIEQMASKSKAMYVQFNNCHAGSALRNLKMMQFLLGMNLPPMQADLIY